MADYELSEHELAVLRQACRMADRLEAINAALRDAPLTLKQIDIVKDEFTRVLTGMYHNRIDYPTSSGGVTSEFASV